jgi:glyoxylase-like metal-dependent hydrolase (beta-lactamase superfamily II)
MSRKITLAFILSVITLLSHGQADDTYKVYAVKFSQGWKIAAKDLIIGSGSEDSVFVCNMFWLLRSKGGRNILVDAGYIDTASNPRKNFVRPDLVLKRIGINPSEISDIIITHPHADHIGGLNLFPAAKFWMQKEDFNYFTGEAWQEHGDNRGFEKNDVRNLIELNLQGRLKLIQGDNMELFPGIKVFTGSKHTYENQYLVVNTNSVNNKILLASDAIWFYLNFEKMLPVSICLDPKSYVEAMKRMKTLGVDRKLIIPGHDDSVFSIFPEVAEWIVLIGDQK